MSGRGYTSNVWMVISERAKIYAEYLVDCTCPKGGVDVNCWFLKSDEAQVRAAFEYAISLEPLSSHPPGQK